MKSRLTAIAAGTRGSRTYVELGGYDMDAGIEVGIEGTVWAGVNNS